MTTKKCTISKAKVEKVGGIDGFFLILNVSGGLLPMGHKDVLWIPKVLALELNLVEKGQEDLLGAAKILEGKKLVINH